MDVRAKNRGRPHQKVRFFCGPGDVAPLQALCCALCSTEQSNFRGG